MNLETIRQYVATHMHTWDTNNPNVDTVYDNRIPDQQNTDRTWVRLNTDYGNAITASIDSSPKRRRTGTVTIQVFTPKNTGLRNATLVADSLVSHFEYARSDDRKIQFLTTNVIPVNNDNYYQMNVVINFRASDV